MHADTTDLKSSVERAMRSSNSCPLSDSILTCNHDVINTKQKCDVCCKFIYMRNVVNKRLEKSTDA